MLTRCVDTVAGQLDEISIQFHVSDMGKSFRHPGVWVTFTGAGGLIGSYTVLIFDEIESLDDSW